MLFDRCPKAWVVTDAAAEVALYSDYRWYADRGTLPVVGGKLDQSPCFIEAVGIFDAVTAELRSKEGANVG